MISVPAGYPAAAVKCGGGTEYLVQKRQWEATEASELTSLCHPRRVWEIAPAGTANSHIHPLLLYSIVLDVFCSGFVHYTSLS